MSKGTQEVRFDLRVGKECLVDGLIVKTGHGTSVKPQRTGSENEIGTLQGAVAKCRGFDQLVIALKPGLGISVGKSFGR